MKKTSKSKARNDDLHGNVPDFSPTALLLVDVINDLNFPGNAELLEAASELANNIARLKARCRKAGIPAIYVNDNRDKWRSDFRHVLKHCLLRSSPGRAFVRKLAPLSDDYIILKPKHSAFYASPLEAILKYLGARKIILVGLTTNACILGTAIELYVRDYEIVVPSDCVRALTRTDHQKALEQMRKSFGVHLATSDELKID